MTSGLASVSIENVDQHELVIKLLERGGAAQFIHFHQVFKTSLFYARKNG